MAYTPRTLAKLIGTMTPPTMGEDWNSPNASNPSSFNDLVNQLKAIDEAGHIVASQTGACVAGSYRPLVGDWGNTFTHSDQVPLVLSVGIPSGMTRYSLQVLCNSFDATQQVSIYLGSQALFSSNTIGIRANTTSGLLAGTNVVTNGEVQQRFLELRSVKGVTGAATNMTNRYWDGIMSFCLAFYR